MPKRLELPIDVEEVAEAMDVGTRDTIDFFLDMQSGAVVVTGDGVDEEIDVDDDRYQEIPPRDTSENYELMREFIDALDDRGFAERLSHAIRGAGAFGRFKRELSGRRDVEARWYAFRDAALRQDALDWLRSINVQPTPPSRSSGGEPATEPDRRG
jgi:hypothetical protein